MNADKTTTTDDNRKDNGNGNGEGNKREPACPFGYGPAGRR